LFELAEEILDEMSRLVGILVEIALDLAAALGRDDDRLSAASSGSMTRSSASKALSASKVSAAMSGSSASAPFRSWAWPSGLPRASTSA
jgi:hypothetical protein